MLPAKPVGVGRPVADRAAWDVLAKAREFRGVVAKAEELLPQAIPDPTDELYLDFSRTGNRTRYQRVWRERRGRLSALVLAECLENRGRFLSAIEATVRATCAEKSWLLPAHDRDLKNFRGEVVEIDLASAAVSWDLATMSFWLGDKLSADVRTLIAEQLERRAFQPYESYVKTGQPQLWWATGTNNWNAVCLAGVTGAALAAIEPAERRAFYAAAAERYIEYFLKGFTPDGYCSEGMGYWNYGFGNYISLAETLHQATGGRIDWLAEERIEPIAGFGRRMEIVARHLPGFCRLPCGRRAGHGADGLLEPSLRLGPEERRAARPADGQRARREPVRAGFVRVPQFGFGSASRRRGRVAAATRLVCRRRHPPLSAGGQGRTRRRAQGRAQCRAPQSQRRGLVRRSPGPQHAAGRPGAEVYTARTFSGRRYESKLLNSFGHPVPRIAGQLQQTGRKAAAGVLRTEWTDAADTLVLDLRSAYAVKGLEKLQRTFRFSREGEGQLEVLDEVQLAQPETFETALITFGKWKQATASKLTIGDRDGSAEVDIDTDGAAFTIRAEEIQEDRDGPPPTRLAIVLNQPVRTATVRMTIRPAP